MIKIVKGDLLLAKENFIAHQVNCQGVMGSGVADQIKKKFPVAFTEYKKLVDLHMSDGVSERSDLLGKVQGVGLGNEQYIVNIFGQDNYGKDGKQYTNEHALFQGFKEIRKVAEDNNYSVAMPYMIGCYRGGADWKLVEDYLLTAFEGYEVTLYKMHKG